MLKKVLKWIGIFCLGLILLFGLIAGYTYYSQSKYKETAVPYIQKVVPIISEWDVNNAKVFFVPSVIENAPKGELEKLFNWFSKLGKLQSLEDPQFIQMHSEATVKDGANTIVTYTVLGHYEKGDAQITIRLLDLGESFEIYYFYISSNALIE